MKLLRNLLSLKSNDIILIKYPDGTISIEKIVYKDENGGMFDYRTITLYTNNWEIKEWMELNPDCGGDGLLNIAGETIYLLNEDEIKNAIIFEGIL